MVKISVEEFKTFTNKERYIFFFTLAATCGACNHLEREFTKYSIPNLIKVVGSCDEELQELDLGAVPCTRLFNDAGKVRYEKYGVLYDVQINQLLKEFVTKI